MSAGSSSCTRARTARVHRPRRALCPRHRCLGIARDPFAARSRGGIASWESAELRAVCCGAMWARARRRRARRAEIFPDARRAIQKYPLNDACVLINVEHWIGWDGSERLTSVCVRYNTMAWLAMRSTLGKQQAGTNSKGTRESDEKEKVNEKNNMRTATGLATSSDPPRRGVWRYRDDRKEGSGGGKRYTGGI